jgi:hypothetical protein
MNTTDGAAIPGVVAMSAREIKALHGRVAELEAALHRIDSLNRELMLSVEIQEIIEALLPEAAE